MTARSYYCRKRKVYKAEMRTLPLDVTNDDNRTEIKFTAHTARKDPGGQTGLVAFRTLVDRLIPAFESATGIRAPVTNDTTEMYGGQFLEFMYAVVEMVRRLFPSISYPNSGLAVAVFVYKRVTSLRRKSHKGAKRKSGLARGLRRVRSPIRSAPTAGPAKAQKSDIAT